MRFADPWFLLLALAAVLVVVVRSLRKPAAVLYSDVSLVRAAGSTFRGKIAWIPLAMRVCCLALLAVAIARPQYGQGVHQENTDGVAIMLVVDQSGSMQEEMPYEGEPTWRLEVVKKVMGEFLLGNEQGLDGRPNDLVGMVSFARYPHTVCPLVQDHRIITELAEPLKPEWDSKLGGTAIGDALALAAARLHKAEVELEARRERVKSMQSDIAFANEGTNTEGFAIKSKVIVLLTDGQQQAGELSPMEGAEIAKEWGVKVYAIGIVGGDGTIYNTPRGRVVRLDNGGADEPTMRKIAKETGGRYWSVDNAEAMREVYRQIDELEKTEITSVEYTNYDERFMPWALAAFAAIALEILLGTIVFRRFP